MSDNPNGVPVECPHCKAAFHVCPSAVIPKEQTMYLEMTSESAFFSARVIGEQICNMVDLLESVAKSQGAHLATMLHSFTLEPNKVKIGFLLVDAPPRKKKGEKQ